MAVGERIKIVRKMNKLNQLKFSRILGLSQAHISNIESNKDNPSDKILHAISDEFHINFEWLKYGTGEIENYNASEDYTNSTILELKKILTSDNKMKTNVFCSAIQHLINIYNCVEKLDSNVYIYNDVENLLSMLDECISKYDVLPSNSIEEQITMISLDRLDQSQVLREIYFKRINTLLDILLTNLEEAVKMSI